MVVQPVVLLAHARWCRGRGRRSVARIADEPAAGEVGVPLLAVPSPMPTQSPEDSPAASRGRTPAGLPSPARFARSPAMPIAPSAAQGKSGVPAFPPRVSSANVSGLATPQATVSGTAASSPTGSGIHGTPRRALVTENPLSRR
uniref:Uncharacterized protein n=1 Tax=Neobodo designis TaxID=312471 RepID=A0A7S1PRZ8_NEODS